MIPRVRLAPVRVPPLSETRRADGRTIHRYAAERILARVRRQLPFLAQEMRDLPLDDSEPVRELARRFRRFADEIEYAARRLDADRAMRIPPRDRRVSE